MKPWLIAPLMLPLLTIGPSAQAATTYRVEATHKSQGFRWHPCLRIHWEFLSTGFPSGGLVVTEKAIKRLSDITGVTLHNDGKTTQVPTGSYSRPTAPGRT